MRDELDKFQQALTDFLEEKRAQFPRFYFIGDDDLLEILGQANNPAVIQAHLKKLFQGIHRVQFTSQSDSSSQSISAMISASGELVPLFSPVAIQESVEVWLKNCEFVKVLQ